MPCCSQPRRSRLRPRATARSTKRSILRRCAESHRPHRSEDTPGRSSACERRTVGGGPDRRLLEIAASTNSVPPCVRAADARRTMHRSEDTPPPCPAIDHQLLATALPTWGGVALAWIGSPDGVASVDSAIFNMLACCTSFLCTATTNIVGSQADDDEHVGRAWLFDGVMISLLVGGLAAAAMTFGRRVLVGGFLGAVPRAASSRRRARTCGSARWRRRRRRPPSSARVCASASAIRSRRCARSPRPRRSTWSATCCSSVRAASG